jgi:hypothetical protein
LIVTTKNEISLTGRIIFTDGGTIYPPGFVGYVTRGCSGKTFLVLELKPAPPYVFFKKIFKEN